MSCHHPSVWRFLTILKREQGLVEVKQAFYISGRNPSKRRYFEEREKALENLVESYLLRPKFEFLRGVSYHFTFSVPYLGLFIFLLARVRNIYK